MTMEAAGDGCTIAYRTEENDPLTEALVGGCELPWALEVTARRRLGLVGGMIGSYLPLLRWFVGSYR